MDGHAVVLVEVLAVGVWGVCEDLQLSSRLHVRDALHSCYYYYLMCINHCSSNSASARLIAWLLPTQSQARLHFWYPVCCRLQTLCGLNARFYATGSHGNYVSAWDRPEGKPSWHSISAFLRALLGSGGTATCMTCSSGLSSITLQPQVHF